tara:strand:+ start:2915 stop:3514 length:600 start_codon:yes stop_codon:yes gene_type:complete
MKEELVSLNTPDATNRLILLHGWGADAKDLIPVGEILRTGFIKKLDVISLNAPHDHPQGIGRQWYSLFPPDWSEVPSAVNSLRFRLKAMATKKIPLERTVLLGFSQGGAMALATGCNLPLAGLIGCSAYPHPSLEFPKNSPPIFLTHGKNDDVVPISAMESIIQLKRNTEIETTTFNGGHEIPPILIPKILEVIKSWLL